MRGVYALKPWKDRVLHGLAKNVGKYLSANVITGISLCTGVSAAFLWRSNPYASIILLLMSVFGDLLDGTIARLQGASTLYGKLFDAVSDRIVETSWVGMLVFTCQIPWWGVFMPIGSIVLLFCRYLAYCHGQETSYILVTRFERVAAMLVAGVLPWTQMAHLLFFIVTIGTWSSVMAIMAHLRVFNSHDYFLEKP